MSEFEITFTVIVEAEDLDEAEIISDEIEGHIAGTNFVKRVYQEDLEELK